MKFSDRLIEEYEKVFMTKANEKQIGGDHYKSSIQHWDYVIANDLDYFQAQITKYVTRWRKKGGIKDLEKALHFLEKYIEVEKMKSSPTITGELPRTWEVRAGSYVPVEGQKNPFGYNANKELGVESQITHPEAGMMHNNEEF
jgi:hypothetical protein